MPARKHKYRYYLPEQGESEVDARPLLSIWEPSEAEDVALEWAAEWYRGEPGWEASWPVVFVLLHKGREIGRYNVEMEMVPDFYIGRH